MNAIESHSGNTCTDLVPTPPVEWRARKAREFDRLAPFYDALAWLATAGTVGRLYKRVAVMAGGMAPSRGEGLKLNTVAVDLCCGTGGVTQRLAERFEHVVGMDLSAGMLQLAAKRRSAANVEYRRTDALMTRPVQRAVDAVTCAFGVHELPPSGRERLFRHASSLLRPGGRLVICDYAIPRTRLGRLFARIFGLYVERRQFLGYLEEDLESLAELAGLRLITRERAVVGLVRILVFERSAMPAQLPSGHETRT